MELGGPRATSSKVTLDVEDSFVDSKGTRLEARLYRLPPGSRTTKLAFCAHPAGALGATQDNHAVLAIVKELLAEGFETVTYNARGVDKSGGWPTLLLNAEADDYQAIVDHFVRTRQPSSTSDATPRNLQEVIFAGYSAGSVVATAARLPDGIQARIRYIVVGYPARITGMWPWTWQKRFDKAQALIDAPVLSVHCSRDTFAPSAAYKAWKLTGKSNVTTVEVDAEHFFRDGTVELQRAVREWVACT